MRVLFIFLGAFCLLSCAGKNDQAEENTDAVETTAMETEAVLHPGQQLIEGSDCQTCHHTKNTLVGPSYTAIATKYENSADTKTYLISKIKNGGSGVWGDTPMLAHPTLSDEDAGEMVNYIMTLKPKQ
ncbi:MAG: cytochrome c class I [Cytophagia bacterium]|nr:cytochrome c class I [Cytophagia bacterium]